MQSTPHTGRSRRTGFLVSRVLVSSAVLATVVGLRPGSVHAAAGAGGLEDLLSSVSALVGSSRMETRALAVYQENCLRIQAAAGTKSAAGGLSGLLTALTGHESGAAARVTYGQYEAEALVGSSSGLDSVAGALRALLRVGD